ncbi:MAG TPA: hypothetical protein VMM76_07970 [Pirellulaceae bacterium]|nr:hypothetical protein [Pirellulaceae bacterium]
MNWPQRVTIVMLVVAWLFFAYRLWSAIGTGSVTHKDGPIRRDDQPVLYWMFVALLFVFVFGIPLLPLLN